MKNKEKERAGKERTYDIKNYSDDEIRAEFLRRGLETFISSEKIKEEYNKRGLAPTSARIHYGSGF